MSSGFSGPTVYAGRDIDILWQDPILFLNPWGMHREDPAIEQREFRESNSWKTLKEGEVDKRGAQLEGSGQGEGDPSHEMQKICNRGTTSAIVPFR